MYVVISLQINPKENGYVTRIKFVVINETEFEKVSSEEYCYRLLTYFNVQFPTFLSFGFFDSFQSKICENLNLIKD